MKEIIYSSCLAWTWVYILGFIRFKYKPINCAKCMSAWICLALCVGRFPIWEVPFLICIAMICTIILTAMMNKL